MILLGACDLLGAVIIEHTVITVFFLSPSFYIHPVPHHYCSYSLAGFPLRCVAGTTLFFLFSTYIVSMKE